MYQPICIAPPHKNPGEKHCKFYPNQNNGVNYEPVDKNYQAYCVIYSEDLPIFLYFLD